MTDTGKHRPAEQQYLTQPFRKYADFKGRARRKEFWMFFILMYVVSMIVLLPTLLIEEAVSGSDPSMIGFISMACILIAVFIVPMTSVTVRRLHDAGYSGWFVLLTFIPYIGTAIALLIGILKGQAGTNRYGADPKLEDDLAWEDHLVIDT